MNHREVKEVVNHGNAVFAQTFFFNLIIISDESHRAKRARNHRISFAVKFHLDQSKNLAFSFTGKSFAKDPLDLSIIDGIKRARCFRTTTSYVARERERQLACDFITFRHPHHVRETRKRHRGSGRVLRSDNVSNEIGGARVPVVLATAEPVAALEPRREILPSLR